MIMNDEMIKQLRRADLNGDRLAGRILEMLFVFEDFEQTIGVR